MELPRTIDAVVIGAGQAGLIMSRLLQEAGREHVVVERRETLGGGWQDRWDGFQVVSPNFVSRLPGFPYEGSDPDGFMTRDEIADRTRRYADVIGAPVVLGVDVTRLGANGRDGRRFHLETSAGPVDADSVVSATGGFHVPRIPNAASGIARDIAQLHAHHYRNPDQLPPGGRIRSDGGPARRGASRGGARGRAVDRALWTRPSALSRPRHLLVARRPRRARPGLRDDAADSWPAPRSACSLRRQPARLGASRRA